MKVTLYLSKEAEAALKLKPNKSRYVSELILSAEKNLQAEPEILSLITDLLKSDYLKSHQDNLS